MACGTVAAIDIESKDPNLKKKGPGFVRNDAKVLGVGIYCPGLGIDGYFRPEHPVVKRVLSDADIKKVGHNLLYDLNGLMLGEHLEVRGPLEDTMTRMGLLDAYRLDRKLSYDLDSCCETAGVEGKNKEDTIEAWYVEHGLGKARDAIGNLDRVPFEVVGKYCRQDCKSALALWEWQEPQIEEQGLRRVNDVEAQQHYWLMETKKNGMRIDRQKWREAVKKGEAEEAALNERFRREYGDYNINSHKDLERLFDDFGIPKPVSPEGKVTFNSKDALPTLEHPVGRLIMDMRRTQKVLHTFLYEEIDGMSYKDHIHPELKPSKADDSGTVTGRYACRQPNGQNMPARAGEWGKLVRSMFVPEEGCLLGAFDYKQIEYRVFAHFAVGAEGKKIHDIYREHPETDYHQMTMDLLGWGSLGKEGRRLAKMINFGTIYGMGEKAFVRDCLPIMHSLHPEKELEELKEIAALYRMEYTAKVPFVFPTIEAMLAVARSRGYLKTVLGRRQRMPPVKKQKNGKMGRAEFRLANFLCQGSAADLSKLAIAESWKAGVWNVLKSAMMVHDELVFSIPRTREGFEACEALAECMCNSIRLNVPIDIDREIGPDWGHCTEENWHDFVKAVA